MKAVLYLRSSKDRSDVSIAAQRRKLEKLAKDRNFEIHAEYLDVVESAKSEDRDGLQSLMRDMKLPARPWNTIITLNTSRLSRRQWFAFVFRRECEREKIDLIFEQVPDMDPVSALIMHSVLTAMDEIHSLKSREDGIAGMKENVRQGWRAGGRAPKGYQLDHVETDVVRDGRPVLKSRLAPSTDLPMVGRYLAARARKQPRTAVKRDLGISWPTTTLISLEWNALTYAGHTVWNRHAPSGSGRKYRPRSEWIIENNTHEGVISDAEAKILIHDRENSRHAAATSAGKAGASGYLLTGLLVAPDGRPWTGCEGKYYRFRHPGQSRRVHRELLDKAILGQLQDNMTDAEFLEGLASEARSAAKPVDEIKRLKRSMIDINRKIDRCMELAIELTDHAPAMRKVDQLERERNDISYRIRDIELEAEERAVLANVTADDVKQLLNALDDPIALLKALVVRVTLDPDDLACRIDYRLDVPDRLSMASPRGRTAWPVSASAEAILPESVAARRRI